MRVFDDPSVYPVVAIFENAGAHDPYLVSVEVCAGTVGEPSVAKMEHSSDTLSALPDNIWGFLISDYLPIILTAQAVSDRIDTCGQVNASSTAAEADGYPPALHNAASRNALRFINTGTIDRYATTWGVTELTHMGRHFVTPFLDLSASAVSETRAEQYRTPKLLFAKLVKRLEVFLDSAGDYASANTNCVSHSQYDLRYLLAVLNSALMSVIYRGYFGALTMQGGYLQVQSPQIRVLPIRRIATDVSDGHRGHSRERIAEMIVRYRGTRNGEELEALCANQLALTPERADVVYDVLVELGALMCDIGTSVQVETTGFLTWLHHELGCPVESLSGRKSLYKYYELEPDGLFDVLRRNRRRIQSNLSSREVHDALNAEFARSVSVVRPHVELMQSIDSTIDRIVYLLYGLDDECIQMVERARLDLLDSADAPDEEVEAIGESV